MHISFDTEHLTDEDRRVLAVLAGDSIPVATVTPAPTTPAAKTATPAAKKTVAPEPVKEPEPEADEDLLETAIKLAKNLVASGKAVDVKAALTKFDAKKVGELSEDDLPGFIAELQG